MFVSGGCPVRVAAACRGPKAERSRRRVAKVVPRVVATESSNEATSRPSGQRGTAPFQAAERRSARRQRFVGNILRVTGNRLRTGVASLARIGV